MGIKLSELPELLNVLLGIISITASAIAGYVIYRKKEIFDLAVEVVRAYDDKNISEEEYDKIIEKLRKVIFK